jgi:hypothetical protein
LYTSQSFAQGTGHGESVVDQSCQNDLMIKGEGE